MDASTLSVYVSFLFAIETCVNASRKLAQFVVAILDRPKGWIPLVHLPECRWIRRTAALIELEQWLARGTNKQWRQAQ